MSGTQCRQLGTLIRPVICSVFCGVAGGGNGRAEGLMVMQAGRKMGASSSAQREVITAAAAFLSLSRALPLAAQMSNFIN